MKPDSYSLEPGREIRALTVWQPWATLLCRKEKRWESRPWRPPDEAIGEEMAIHSARRWKSAQQHACKNDRAIRRGLINCERLPSNNTEADQMLPRGRVLCIMTLERVEPASYLRNNPGALSEPRVNVNLGDYSEGRFGWRFSVEYVYDTPPPVRGQQGIWKLTVPDDPGR